MSTENLRWQIVSFTWLLTDKARFLLNVKILRSDNNLSYIIILACI